MCTILINFVGFWKTFDKENNFIIDSLRKNFNVQISNNPDYLFVSCFEGFLEHIKYKNAVKIFYSAEDISPDFTFFDYAIGYNDFKCGDRYIQFPIYLHHENWSDFLLSKCTLEESKEIAKKKDIFCNFIYNEDRFDKKRSEIFNKLSEYKKVEAFGKLCNNQPNSKTVSYLNIKEKFDVLSRSKFTLAIDSVELTDFVTEKIHNAFYCKSIPIYIGDKTVAKYFNKKAFIDFNDFSSFNDLITYIKKVDTDDSLYLNMLQEEPLVNKNFFENCYKNLDNFLFQIVSQEKKFAYRRPLTGKIITSWNREISSYVDMRCKFLIRLCRKIYSKK